MAFPFFTKKKDKVSDTLLSGGVSLSLLGEEVTAPAPTLATWVEVSGLVSQIRDLPEDEVSLFNILEMGEDAAVYAKILASFLVGVRRDNAKERKVKADELMYRLSVKELSAAFFSILEQSNIQELFTLTTSLKQMRLTKPTREVVDETTAPGLG